MYFTHRYTHDIPMIHDKLMFSQLQGPYRRHLIVGALDANCWELALCETLRNSMEMLSRNLESGPCNDPIAPTFANPQMKQDPKSVVPAMSTWYCSWMLKFILLFKSRGWAMPIRWRVHVHQHLLWIWLFFTFHHFPVVFSSLATFLSTVGSHP